MIALQRGLSPSPPPHYQSLLHHAASTAPEEGSWTIRCDTAGRQWQRCSAHHATNLVAPRASTSEEGESLVAPHFRPTGRRTDRAKLDPVLDAVGDKTTRRRSARRRSSRRGVGIQALCPRGFGRRPGRTILNAGSTWEPSAGSLSGPPWSESSNPRSPCQPARVGSAYVFGGTSSVSIGSPR